LGQCVSQLSIAVTKYLRQTRQKEEMFTLILSFRVFSPELLGPVVFGPVARQCIMVEACVRGKLITLLWSGSKE
jgi:hypothetical protein